MVDWSASRVLVTGGTGSFGNFIVRRLLEIGTEEVRILSRDEKKQFDMKVFYEGEPRLTSIVGDIRDPEVVNEAVQNVNIVFQAAALKQVASCEAFPGEAIRTNVLGVENLVRSALKAGVKKVITISTDKAVKPVNVMGMTKSLQERIILRGNLSKYNQGTKLSCVRYGNVLRSRGSVVPFFRSRLAKGAKLPITDLRMTRFLLTLDDAIDLVMFAAENCVGGEILVRKAPAAKILDLAKLLAEEEGQPLQYQVIGTLPGEKIHEILVSEEELPRVEDLGQYYRVNPWWATKTDNMLTSEFSSKDCLLKEDGIKELLRRADEEFERMELPEGEFAKF